MLEALVSKRGQDGSSNWDCMCCCMGHLLVVYYGPHHWLVQPSYPSLKEQLGSALLGAQ